MGRHLAGEHDHRDRVHVRGCNARYGVGHTRPGSDQTHTGLVRRARVTVRGVRGALFVADQDVLDLLLFEKLVVDVEHGAAGITEDVLHTFVLKATDDNFCAGKLHGSRPKR